jgi:hypothetical protein
MGATKFPQSYSIVQLQRKESAVETAHVNTCLGDHPNTQRPVQIKFE